MSDYLKDFPPSIYNNSRRIVREMVKKANERKYDTSLNMAVEEITGESNDRTGYDAGNDPLEAHPLAEHN